MSNNDGLVIHGCPFNTEQAMDPVTRTYDKHWLPWLKRQLIANGLPTAAPLMPDPWAPDYQKFKEEFEKYKVDNPTIKEWINKIIISTSDNERPDGKVSLLIYQQALGGEVIELKQRGHYIFKDMGTEEFPELLQVILSQ